MGNPYNRPKHLQNRAWFKIEIEGKVRVVRPVDGEEWFGGASIKAGVVYLVDEDSELVSVIEIGTFDRNAKRVGKS